MIGPEELEDISNTLTSVLDLMDGLEKRHPDYVSIQTIVGSIYALVDHISASILVAMAEVSTDPRLHRAVKQMHEQAAANQYLQDMYENLRASQN